MLGHKSILPHFFSYPILVLFFLVLSVAAEALKKKGSNIATNTTPVKEELARQPVNRSSSRDSTNERASTAVDAAPREEKSPNSKSDPPKANPAAPPPVAPCQRTINADVVALPQPIMLNRMGAAIPDALVFALKADTAIVNGWLQLKPGKRPRPLVLRANVGDCLNITFTNSVPKNNFTNTKAAPPTGTTEVSLHIQGMEWTTSTMDDGSFVGVNPSSLVNAPNPLPAPQQYKLFVKHEGTFLLYTMGDTSSEGDQLARGLFGALNVEPAGAEWYRSQVTQQDLKLATKATSADGHPVIDYNAKYQDGTPILKMLDANNNIVHTDLTAIITGPNAGRFPGTTGPNTPEPPCNAENNPALVSANGIVDPLFCQNPAAPDRKQPYREVTIIYHEVGAVASQAFPVFNDLSATLAPGADGFAINYGTGGIGAEVYANRIGVGPMGPCVDCKFEEFFLSAWSVGDPAMLVDKPANSNNLTQNANFQPPCNTTPAFNQPPCGGTRVPGPNNTYTMQPTAKATVAFFPDDPSNVYHSYINDHIKFRILHGGTGVTHVHHQHAHQWLQSPNSDEGSYLDSQMISPGSSYTLEMTYNGSGNRNKVVGDSIFHCHFYPHFAAGMWAMWRTHDVFESGSQLANGMPAAGTRALPDGEIKTGTPIPAIVPLPTIPMAPLPQAQAEIVNGQIKITGNGNPGFPFFIPGLAGARAPHPPLDFAPDTVNGGLLDGGLPRHLVTGGSISYERHNKFDWSKDLATINAVKLPEDGTAVEKAAIAFFSKRCYATFFPDGTPGSCPSSNSTPPQSTLNRKSTGFILNGLPLGPQHGAPFADPAVDDNGNPVGLKRTYKAAAIQLNVTFNKKGWHFPQQRILTLWDDVRPTLAYTPGGSTGRAPEPLFFRGNSGDVIEYWHTNLVPNYYLVDDFQVRTPTDILGQHIHLVKFDVTSSDGAGNGFNYEDGTFSPEEVRDLIKWMNNPNQITGGQGLFAFDPTTQWANKTVQTQLQATAPPTEITNGLSDPSHYADCSNPNDPNKGIWCGAQTTVQRWYADPLLNLAGKDRTIRTVFTHDHFGPSTHQQVGLYAALVVEPTGSTWRDSQDGTLMGTRSDGGPTSWQAIIRAANVNDSYREFLFEIQDMALAYGPNSKDQKQFALSPYPCLGKTTADCKTAIQGVEQQVATAVQNGTTPSPWGWADYPNAINPLFPSNTPPKFFPVSSISGNIMGSQLLNYRNEPLPNRVIATTGPNTNQTADGAPGNLSHVFRSINRPESPAVNVQPVGGTNINPTCVNIGKPWDAKWPCFTFPKPITSGMSAFDPFTPLARVYEGDKVQVRVLPGAHMSPLYFTVNGVNWLFEPGTPTDPTANNNSGYRATQPMGISEHWEMLFTTPSATAAATSPCTGADGKSQVPCTSSDYLYTGNALAVGLQNGMWGLLRAYKNLQNNLMPLPNNAPADQPGGGGKPIVSAGCPAYATKTRTYDVTAINTQLVYNSRATGSNSATLTNPDAIIYVMTDDLNSGNLSKMKIEPLVLRAAAGECVEVRLTNKVTPTAAVFTTPTNPGAPFGP